MKNIQFLNKKQSTKKGFALTEVLLAIAVIVIIGIAAYPLYKNARTSSEVEAMANDMAIIQTNAQTLYSGQSSYNPGGASPITAAQLETAGMAPDDLKTGVAGVWNNSWGGTVTINPAPAVAGLIANAGFTITVANVPTSACTQLVNRVAPSFLAIGTGAAASGANDAIIKGTVGGTNATKVDVGATATLCAVSPAILAFTAR